MAVGWALLSTGTGVVAAAVKVLSVSCMALAPLAAGRPKPLLTGVQRLGVTELVVAGIAKLLSTTVASPVADE